MEGKSDRSHRVFLIAVQLKVANALLEVVGGILAIVVPPGAITRLALSLTVGELARHSADVFTRHLYIWAQNYSIGQAHFVALYLLSHGTIKLGLVIGLLKGRMWVYPVAIVVFGFFVLFETYLVVVKRSPLVALLLAVDIFLIVFIRREYKNLRSRRDGDRRENLPNLA